MYWRQLPILRGAWSNNIQGYKETASLRKSHLSSTSQTHHRFFKPKPYLWIFFYYLIMHLVPLLLTLLVTSSGVLATKSSSCAPFSSSLIEFSSGFKEPSAPLVKDEYTASFIQHKWYEIDALSSMLLRSYSYRNFRNQDLSHITAGYISNSPSLGIVLADEASYSGLASSLFNYANTTQDGLVDNTLSTYSSSSRVVEVWRGYINSGFPLFARDFLVTNKAIFGGLVKRRFNEGYVASVSFPGWLLARPKSLK